MNRADQHTQQQIADLVRACAGYWELRGIVREHIAEMQFELEQHLQQAASDGKSRKAGREKCAHMCGEEAPWLFMD
jgi:hypothetical protein